MNRTKTILKLKKIIMKGHIPQRGNVQYTPYFEDKINCFIHCLNLSNEQLQEISFDEYDKGNISNFKCKNEEDGEKKLLSFIKRTGLKIEESSKTPLKPNQWKIALYFESLSANVKQTSGDKTIDYHFLINTKNNNWTSKESFRGRVSEYNHLPQNIPLTPFSYYNLYKTYTITNEFAK